MAYIFAAPVSRGSCTGAGTCDLAPGDPTRLSDLATAGKRQPGRLGRRLHRVSRDAATRTATETHDPIRASSSPVPGSLLGKALVAQHVFDNGFLLPFAPDAPDFFLVPGNNQVTVSGGPRPPRRRGDPFFAGGQPADLTDPEPARRPNPLYDPNYRQFDVEGYRVYRGRVDSPN